MVHRTHCLAEKVQALTLLEWGIPPRRVAEVTNFSTRQLYRLQATARKRGYDPTVSLVIKDEYLAVAPRSGRPRKIRLVKEGGALELSAATELVDEDGTAARALARRALDRVSDSLPSTEPLGNTPCSTEETGTGKVKEHAICCDVYPSDL